ncbi:CDP-alcohol phosphatidyltransferase family protein [Waterburya agarophytonicola K14]|uniref:CDP-diacylglycerol--inositol 3-phosphatidyltransferase n=1 Tax=Waterburya agarophytonicola KI4 TaxID=2874699 RepID=A0A964BQK3_9CYAN|nr:CDP-alcohol phosphatidyltransferase family protein [Waterburya agarophytonicola]MCC0176311.1 CDP-alcohol phosphatidyltransferase family protein [Waterburya agarophytonicola KI4]
MAINKVFLFVPNIIGYARFLFYLIAFICHSLGSWQLCIGFYAFAFILDEFDGRAARAYNQSSNFGAALDMVADRSATAGFCLILAQLYPQYLLFFIGAIALDISSHYYLIYATGMLGLGSHKDSSEWTNNGLMRLYYGNKTFMDLLILGNELFYILLYFNFYLTGGEFTINDFNLDVWQLLLIFCLPIYLLKQSTNILQLQSAAQEIAKIDLNDRH